MVVVTRVVKSPSPIVFCGKIQSFARRRSDDPLLESLDGETLIDFDFPEFDVMDADYS